MLFRSQSVTTTSTDEALRYALDRKFAVVIADHNMPDMMGADLLHRFAQIQPAASRILITGIKSLDIVTAAVNSGEIFRFVTKPWISAEMMATLHNAVQRYELIETNRSLERTTLDLNQKLSDANARLEKQLRELEAGIEGLRAFEGSLSAGGDRLLAAFTAQDRVGALMYTVWYFVSLRYDENQRDNDANARRQQVQILFAKHAQDTSWFNPELLAIPIETVRG